MDCGWWCSPLPQSLENQISTALMMDYELLAEKGRNGRKLILDKYSTEVVSNQMIQLYSIRPKKADLIFLNTGRL